jgi:hypothetical protein
MTGIVQGRVGIVVDRVSENSDAVIISARRRIASRKTTALMGRIGAGAALLCWVIWSGKSVGSPLPVNIAVVASESCARRQAL